MKRAYNMVQKYVVNNSRFGIPVLMSTECPHGHQALGGYLLPVNLGVGAAWNPDLAQAAYQVCGEQMKDLGGSLCADFHAGYAARSPLGTQRRMLWGGSLSFRTDGPSSCKGVPETGRTGCGQAFLRAGGDHRGALMPVRLVLVLVNCGKFIFL